MDQQNRMATLGLSLLEHGRVDLDRHNALLLVGSKGFIPDCNLVAIMHDLPHFTIHSVPVLADTLNEFDPPPVALLIHEDCITGATESDLALLALHADRTIAVVVENAKRMSDAVSALVRSELIKGILPMNLRLELWLLALRLLMRGGEFAPISLARSGLSAVGRMDARPPDAAAPKANLATLTKRELQVLQMLSTGCPNRVIAERFSLSEHTVKVHVHNIIRKLSAKNRTAAAAMYLENPA